MDQPWWVFGLIALVCTLLILLIQVVKERFLEKKEDDDGFSLMNVMIAIVAVIGGLSAVRMALLLYLFI